MHPRSEPHRPQHFSDPLVVITVAAWVESDQFCVALLIHVEKGLHVKAPHRLGSGHWRNEKVSDRRRIILARSTTRARPNTAPATGAFARADPAATPRSRARRIGAARSRASRCGSDLRRDDLLCRLYRSLHRVFWFDRLDR